MLIRILYVSEASPGLSRSALHRLVASAQRRNRQLDLTGALLACDGHFAQAIEGQEELVEETMRKIAVDERHHRLRIQERTAITRRLFTHWDMAFIDDARCDEAFRGLLDGRLAPAEFLAAMARWAEESKFEPL